MTAAAPRRSRRPGRRRGQWLQCRLVVGLVRLIHAPTADFAAAAPSSQHPLGDGPADRRPYLRAGGRTMRLCQSLRMLLLSRVPAARRGHRGVGPARRRNIEGGMHAVVVFHGVSSSQPPVVAASSTGNVGNARRVELLVAFAPAAVGARHASRATALSRDTSLRLVMRDVSSAHQRNRSIPLVFFLPPGAGSAICRVCRTNGDTLEKTCGEERSFTRHVTFTRVRQTQFSAVE